MPRLLERSADVLAAFQGELSRSNEDPPIKTATFMLNSFSVERLEARRATPGGNFFPVSEPKLTRAANASVSSASLPP